MIPTEFRSPDLGHGSGYYAYCVGSSGAVVDYVGAVYSYGQADYWWLRSPGIDNLWDPFCYVENYGTISAWCDYGEQYQNSYGINIFPGIPVDNGSYHVLINGIIEGMYTVNYSYGKFISYINIFI